MKTTKQKVIEETIKKVERELAKIDSYLNSNPLSEICKIRDEANKLLEKNKTINERTSDGFIKEIEVLSKREEEQFKLIKKSRNSTKLIERKVELQFELSDLLNELYHIKRI